MAQRKAAGWLAGIAMAIALALGMTGAAWALDQGSTGTLTLDGLEEGATAKAYKVIDVSWDEAADQPQEPVYTWNVAVSAWVKDKYPDYIGADGSVTEKFNNDNAKAFYDALSGAIAKGDPLVSEAAKETVPQGQTGLDLTLPMGGYLVNVASGSGMYVYQPIAHNVVPEFIDGAWRVANPSVKVDVKRSELSIDKKVSNGDSGEKEFVGAQYGDTVNYDVRVLIPEYPDNATNKLFSVADKLSDGLTFEKDSLKVYGVAGDGTETLLANGEFFTVEYDGAYQDNSGTFTFRVKFNYDKLFAEGYESVHLDYNAVVNTDAVIGETGNPNEAKLEFTNDPFDEDGYKTDTDEVTVYSYGIDVLKVGEDGTTPLAGAEFSLSEKADGSDPMQFVREGDGVYHVYALDKDGANAQKTTALIVSADGKLQIKGLNEGVYYLTETKAPEGYNKPSGSVEIEVKDADAGGALDGNVEGQGSAPSGFVHQEIQNSKGFNLPTTGGIGTVGITAVGVAVMAFAAFMLLRTRKSNR